MSAPTPAIPPVNPGQIEVRENIGAPTPSKMGFMGSVKEYKVDITITDHATGTVTVLSIMDKSQAKVQRIASAMFDKLQEQAATTNKIDIKKIKQSLKSDENLDPKVAADLKKMIGNFLKERSASVDILNKYSYSKHMFPLGSKTNLDKAAFTRSTVELTEDDFDVRHFAKEIDVLKNSERFDAKNEKEIKAWAQFAAKMRVAADDSNREKIDELLQDEDIQMILNKGIALFKNFNYLQASDEVDPRLKEMVECFEDLRDRLPADLTNSLAAYQMSQRTVKDLGQSLMSALRDRDEAQQKLDAAPDQASYDVAHAELVEARSRFDKIDDSLKDADRGLKLADLKKAEQKQVYTSKKLRQASDLLRVAQEEAIAAKQELEELAAGNEPEGACPDYPVKYAAAVEKHRVLYEKYSALYEKYSAAFDKDEAAEGLVAEK